MTKKLSVSVGTAGLKLLPLPPMPPLRRTRSSPLGASSSGGLQSCKDWSLEARGVSNSSISQPPPPRGSTRKLGSKACTVRSPASGAPLLGCTPAPPSPAARRGRSCDSACRGGRPSRKAALGSSGFPTGSPQHADTADGPSYWKARGGAGRLPGPSAAPTHRSSARNV